tara:strand:+ start:39167 stop:39856 length:690 start_codon:yes stop_codon:yes gene_type:complete
MPNKFDVAVLELKEVHEIPGAWSDSSFKEVLSYLEFDDLEAIPLEELKDMATLALSDFSPEEAAIKLLELRLGDKLNKGQRQNIAEELRGDKLWEEYSEIKFHEELFNVACMLYWSFPRKFQEPDIVRIRLGVTAQSQTALKDLKHPTAAFIARLLNDGMDEHNTIFRLFHDSLASTSFNEAEHIIWKFDTTEFDEVSQSNTITIYTSWNWVDELKGVNEYESSAFLDK